MARSFGRRGQDRKSTRLNSSHTEIYTLSLHDALPILTPQHDEIEIRVSHRPGLYQPVMRRRDGPFVRPTGSRSEEHTSELQSHRDLHSFPTRRSSDLDPPARRD